MATLSLNKDANETYFSWRDEPERYDWQFTRNKSDCSLLDVAFDDFSDNLHQLGEPIILQYNDISSSI